MNQKILFNENWLFFYGDDADFSKPDCNDSAWKRLCLPHDWDTEFEPDKYSHCGGGGGYAKGGTAWYRKHFSVNSSDLSDSCSILFDGIYMDSQIFLNGELIGGHQYGYTSFEVRLSSLKEGENVIAIRVNNSCLPNSRWYSGSGIYRNVWLIHYNEVHFETWGIRCDTNAIYPQQEAASLQIRTFVKNDSSKSIYAIITHRLYDAQANEVLNTGASLYVEAGNSSCCMARPVITAPHLWSDRDPYLYTLTSELSVDGKIIDRTVTKTGIRTAVFDCDHGFLLNNVSTKIKGMCLHHDAGLTGAAFYTDIWRRRLELLRDMGCNGIRCSHNPPAPELLNLCDEMGFLVMDEIFDEWMLGKNKNDNYYSEEPSYGSSMFFSQHAREDLTAMLHRDYNHPSIILWSIGNEIPEQSSQDGVNILKMLRDICHSEDSTRMVTSACDNIAAIETIRTRREFENELDVVGYNYVGRWRERAETFYEEDRALYPNRRFIGSENPSVGGIRGDYSTDLNKNYASATLTNEGLWRFTASHEYVAGDYLWTGIDYLGETRWPYRGAYFAPIDLAGFPKDSYYYFRSIWNTQDITLHLLPHWNWQGDEGEFKQVVCYTNCDYVSLYINDRLVGTRGYSCPRYGVTRSWDELFGKEYATTNDLHLSWDVPYERGVLRAEGYKDGKLAAVKTIETTGIPASIRASVYPVRPDKPSELIQIEIEAIDADDRFVPTAELTVTCSISGPAQLIGMDSGNLSDLSLFCEPSRKMMAGKLFAVIRPDFNSNSSEPITITFKADGLEPICICCPSEQLQ